MRAYLLLLIALALPAFAVQVTVNPQTTHQTIRGWGATAWVANVDEMPATAREQLLDMAVDDLGLTRLRFETPRRDWEDVLNDDADPTHINWAAFRTTETDRRMGLIILPFKQRVEARGQHFCLYISPSFFDGGSTGSAPAWMLQNPEEYAEWATAFLLYLRDKHGVVPDYFSICNEAGNNNAFSPQVMAKMIKALAPRMKQLGFPTKIQYPECMNSTSAIRYLQALENDPEVWQWIGLISYHLYGDKSQRPAILDFARAKGLPTAQTEYMEGTVNHLYQDLTLGGVSYWEQYTISAGGGGNGCYFFTAPNGASFTTAPDYWNYRQIMHYVRPGAVRVEAASDDPALLPLAFMDKGKATVVLLNNQQPLQERKVSISGLPAGAYNVCQSPMMGGPYVELGAHILRDGVLALTVPANTILTVYPSSAANQPPVLTGCRANVPFLTAPASQASLIATAADPELNQLAFTWSIVAHPAGAQAALATPNAADTRVNGLTVPGNYQFRVTVRDGEHAVSRDHVLVVYAENQPPAINDLHNRKPVTVMLPATRTELRGGARDLEGDPLTYQWTLVKQPDGATAELTAPTAQQCPVTGLTVAGEYVFRFEAKDPTHTVVKELTVRVYPAGTK